MSSENDSSVARRTVRIDRVGWRSRLHLRDLSLIQGLANKKISMRPTCVAVSLRQAHPNGSAPGSLWRLFALVPGGVLKVLVNRLTRLSWW